MCRVGLSTGWCLGEAAAALGAEGRRRRQKAGGAGAGEERAGGGARRRRRRRRRKGAEKRPPAGDDDWVLNVDDFLVELRSQLQQRGLAMNSSDMLRHARRALRQGRWASGLAELIASIVDEERGLPRERGEFDQSD